MLIPQKTAGLLSLWPLLLACADAPVEYRNLNGLNDPGRWDPAECETTLSNRTAWDQPVVRMHIPVDYHAGEKAYPIGWPRMYLNLQPAEQGWLEYDRLEFQIFTESSRTNLPGRPLTFHLYNAQGQKKLIPMDRTAVGKCSAFTINISDIGLTGEITRLGFNINEADYKDQDQITFHIGGFRLARATAVQATEFKAAAPAIFCDSRVLPLEVVIEGPPGKLADGLPLQLCRGDHIALAVIIPVTRGRQRLAIPLANAELAPGAYSLIAFPDQPALRKESFVTIHSSPWK